jgi:hypothetical protein
MEWYLSCIEARDTQGAEKVLLTAIAKGASSEQLANMMLTSVTDHFYLDAKQKCPYCAILRPENQGMLVIFQL